MSNLGIGPLRAGAGAAAGHIADGDSILMEPGTTTGFLAREPRGDNGGAIGASAVEFIARFKVRHAPISIGAVDLLITDHPPPEDMLRALARHRVTVEVAPAARALTRQTIPITSDCELD